MVYCTVISCLSTQQNPIKSDIVDCIKGKSFRIIPMIT